MPSIRITEFGGINPSLSSKLLKSGFAEVAINCDLRTRKLRPWPAPVQVGVVPFGQVDIGAEPFYPQNSAFDNETIWIDQGCRDFVLENWEGTAAYNYGTNSLPYRNAEQGRVFYWRPGDNRLLFKRVGYATEYAAGVTRGPLCSTLQVLGDGIQGGIPFATAYCATYVDDWGGEGPPGPPVLVNNYINGQTCNFVVSDNDPNHTVGRIRVYRAISDFTSGEDVVNAMDTSWHLVAELWSNPGTFAQGYSDSAQQHQIPGDTLISREFFSPPTGQIAGLCKLDGGWLVLAMYDGRIAISQRHQWHAWPGRNIIQMPSNRVADVTAWGDTIIVTFFDRGPAWISVSADGAGINTTIRDYREAYTAFIPALTLGETERQSNRTLTRTPFGAMYWSQSGAVALGPEGAISLATKGVLLPNQIGTQTLLPVSGNILLGAPGFIPIAATWHKGHYITSMQWTAQRCVYALLDMPDDISGSFDNAVLTHLSFDFLAPSFDAGYCIKSWRDQVYVLTQSEVYSWSGLDAGDQSLAPSFISYAWRSKLYEMPAETSFSACKIVLGNYLPRASGNQPANTSSRLRIYCNGRIMVERQVTNLPYAGNSRMKTFRLPSSFRGTQFQIEFTGTLAIDEFHMATSFEELSEQ